MHPKDDLQLRWWKLEEKFMNKFGKKPDVEAILFFDWHPGNRQR